MAFSYVTKTGDGSRTSFTFAFEGQDQGYLRESDIVVIVDGTEVPFTLLSSNTLELQEAPSSGAEILIRRVMPKGVPFADFTRGNNFGQDVLNNSFLQLLYVVHELLDGWFPEGFTVREAVDYLEGLRAFSPDPNDPKSVVNFESGDERYVEVQGDTMQGSLNMDDYPVFVRIAANGNEPSRKDELDNERNQRISGDSELHSRIGSVVSGFNSTLSSEISRVEEGYQSGDANLQSQLTGNVPLEASAFSPISWHDQVIENSVNIPEDKNAWSFGPVMEIAEGHSVSIGDGSYWTIANGDADTVASLESYDEGDI